MKGLITAGNADTYMNVLIGGAEELDTVRLLLQPIQLGAAGCIVYGQYCSFAFVAITLLLPWLFFALQSVSSYMYNSRCNRFHVETCKHVNPIMQHNGHSFLCNYSFQATNQCDPKLIAKLAGICYCKMAPSLYWKRWSIQCQKENNNYEQFFALFFHNFSYDQLKDLDEASH